MKNLLPPLVLSMTIATTTISAQGVIDVHSHIITPEFVSSLENEGRLMDEGFPLPKYNVESHLKWMDEAGVETSVLTLAAPEVIRMMLTITTPDHLLYGSDYPYVAPQVLTQSLARMKKYLSDETDLAPYREMILYQNANELFK